MSQDLRARRLARTPELHLRRSTCLFEQKQSALLYHGGKSSAWRTVDGNNLAPPHNTRGQRSASSPRGHEKNDPSRTPPSMLATTAPGEVKWCKILSIRPPLVSMAWDTHNITFGVQRGITALDVQWAFFSSSGARFFPSTVRHADDLPPW